MQQTTSSPKHSAPVKYGRLYRHGYTLLLGAFLPVLLLHLLWKSRSNPHYRQRWSERFALYSGHSLQPGGIVLHAVSVGELHAAVPVIRHLLETHHHLPITVTTTTPTASAQVSHLFGEQVQHIYLPIDLPWLIHRFLAVLKPRLLLITEAEIWPNLFHQAARYMPVAIINARLSGHTAKRHRRFLPLAASTLSNVNWVAAQTAADAKRYQESGASHDRIDVIGNLKLDLHIAASQLEHAQQLQEQYAGLRIILFASTHEGEEELAISAYLNLRQRHRNLLLVLAPRHPERAARVTQLCVQNELSVLSVTNSVSGMSSVDVILVDVLGQLIAWYGAARLAVLGGTLVSIGGHNPVEAAAMGCPLLIGPYRDTILETTGQLEAAGAVQLFNQVESLEQHIGQLLGSDQQLMTMQVCGKQLISRQGGALKATLSWINHQLSVDSMAAASITSSADGSISS